MRILLASSEVHPYSKTGGLADMVGALGKYLAKTGARVGIVTPLYRGIPDRFPGSIQPAHLLLNALLGPSIVQCRIWQLDPEPNLTVYFVEQPEFFDRDGLYVENGIAFPDNARRFIFFSKIVALLARQLEWKPDIVHVHDWQAALVPLLIHHQTRESAWARPPKTCLTVHNLAYQGVFPAADFQLTNLPRDYFTPQGVEFYGQLNCLKAGLVFADQLTTVSPRYAREITTPEFGCGLDGLLRERRSALVGILNGVDYQEWNTTRNPYLHRAYSLENLGNKTLEKLDLQRELGLPRRADVPLFGTVGRLADQKGMEILLPALEELSAAELQFVLLGSGDPRLELAFQDLAARYPAKIAVHIGYDQGLAHRIEAGCDFFLMPSRFEPCGLNQMYSLRYGTIPIVRRTGGLDDSVADLADDLEIADGIKFQEYSSRALVKAMRKAFALYGEPDLLLHYRENAMTADFSWQRTAQEYLRVYGGLTGVN